LQFIVCSFLTIRVFEFFKTTFTLEIYDEKAEVENSVFEIPKMKLNKELSKMYPNKKVFIVEE